MDILRAAKPNSSINNYNYPPAAPLHPTYLRCTFVQARCFKSSAAELQVHPSIDIPDLIHRRRLLCGWRRRRVLTLEVRMDVSYRRGRQEVRDICVSRRPPNNNPLSNVRSGLGLYVWVGLLQLAGVYVSL